MAQSHKIDCTHKQHMIKAEFIKLHERGASGCARKFVTESNVNETLAPNDVEHEPVNGVGILQEPSEEGFKEELASKGE